MSIAGKKRININNCLLISSYLVMLLVNELIKELLVLSTVKVDVDIPRAWPDAWLRTTDFQESSSSLFILGVIVTPYSVPVP